MTRPMCLLGLFACAALAADPERGPAPREYRPQWQRMLSGEDARRAAELKEQMEVAERRDKWAEALKLAQELEALRARLQGEDHWQVRDARVVVARLKRAPLRAEQQQQFDEANSLSKGSAALHKQRKYREATAPAERALKLFRDVLGDEDPDTVASLNNLAVLYEAQGKYAEAEAMYLDSLRLTTAAKGGGHPDTSTALNNLAGVYETLGKYDQAEVLYRRALRITTDALGERHPEVAARLDNFGSLYSALGRYAEAEALCRDALRLRRAALGERHPDTASSLNNLGHLYYDMSRYAEAEPLYRKALGIFKEAVGENSPPVVTVLNNVGSLYREQGRYAEAEALHREALRVSRQAWGDNHPETASALSRLGRLAVARARYTEAKALFEDALRILKAVRGEKSSVVAITMTDLARAYELQGKFDLAEPLFRDALRIRQVVSGERHPSTAASLNNLAGVLESQGMHAEAEPLYKDAIRINIAILGEKDPDTASGLINLAYLYHVQGRHADAEPLLVQSTRSYEAGRLVHAGRAERAVGSASRNPYPLLAVVSARLGEPAEAFAALEADLARGLLDELTARAGAGLSAHEERDRAELTGRLNGIQARVLRLVTQPAPSEAERKELETLADERRRKEDALARLAAGLSRRQVADLKDIRAALDPETAWVAWVDVRSADGRMQEHWACVLHRTGEPRWEPLPGTGRKDEWTKEDGMLTGRLRAALRGRAATTSEIEALAAKVRAQRLEPIEKHLAGVKRLLVVGAGDMAGLPVELLTDKYQVEYVPSGTAVARAAAKPKPAGPATLLAVGDPVFKAPDAPPPPLPPGGLLVETVVPGGAAGRELKPGDVLLSYAGVDLTDADALGKAIDANAKAKAVPVKFWRITEDGKAVTKVVDLPPGRLGVNVAREPARAVLARRQAADQRLNALTRSGRADPKTGEKTPWAELPGTAVELGALQKLFGDRATVLARSDASEQELGDLRTADKLRGYRYVHFATHGLANDEKAFESFLVLAQDQLPRYDGKEGEKPVNGELSARKVLDGWHLDADLVTLSACETGLGRPAGGDGLLGFAQAFLVAGARSVCLTLWEVDDTATALLMDRFYKNLLGKREGLEGPMTKAAALRQAKDWLRNLTAEEVLKLSADMRRGVTRGKGEELPMVVPAKVVAPAGDLTVKPYADPRAWAAFILVGDPD